MFPNTKTLTQSRTNWGKGKRTATPRVSSTIRQAMGIVVSAKLTTAWTLSLTPMLRRIASVVRASSPRGAEVQAPIWSAC